MIKITPTIYLDESELQFVCITSGGPGGQNVNKVATAVQLRFNVLQSSSLPEAVRIRLLALLGKKITANGELIVKASCHRTQERNKQDALSRLIALLKRASIIPKKRRKTKPTRSSIQRRLNSKKKQSAKKALRRDE